jgi:Phytanoyl-CoA dioxygenase (PhyH).
MKKSQQNSLIRDLMLMRDHILLVHTSETAGKKNSSNIKKSKNKEHLFPYSIVLSRINQEIAEATKSSKYYNYKSRLRDQQQHGNSSSSYSTWLLKKMMRISLMDLPMAILFSLVMLTLVVQLYYHHYISPTIDAARWIHEDASRLQDEFTYYARECDVADVTTDSIRNVILQQDTSTISDDYYEEALDIMMTHGMAVVPSLIDLNTCEELRNYIMKRNMELTADEVIPLDTPQNRWSFGIHANEHVSVANALSQLSSNELLENVLFQLLGHDPAVAEITAISVAPGAEAQGWHSDVKQLGNSVKYAQTFTHSYSLFIPLQDVTNAMGATELCPGTHYCADDDLHDVCVEKGFQAGGDTGEDVWKAGDGLIMNQKMWHRGAAYTAKTGPHRVVFIITFISRPKFGVDHRQLSHGTYFHIHPHMYGHTWNDLKNAQSVMTWPFAPLRSLGIWKPPNANWGWDWVTTSATRIANDQNGYMFEDLVDFVQFHSIGQIIPSWLHGSTTEEGGWQLYFKETIGNFVLFFEIIYVFLFLLMISVTLVMDLCQDFYKHRTKSYIQRTLCWNALIVVITHQVILKLETTNYAKSVQQKSILLDPLSPSLIMHQITTFLKILFQSQWGNIMRQ